MKRLIIICIAISSVFATQAANIDLGKQTFKSRCASCHGIENKMVGPALKGVDKKYELPWIVKFVQSSQTLVGQNDPLAVKTFNENNQVIMPDHKDLSEADIQNIIAYIVDEGSKVVAAEKGKRPVEVKGPNRPIDASRYWVFGVLSVFIVLFVAAFNFAISVNEMKTES